MDVPGVLLLVLVFVAITFFSSKHRSVVAARKKFMAGAGGVIVFALAGGVLGGGVGFLFRPSLPIIGKPPLRVVLGGESGLRTCYEITMPSSRGRRGARTRVCRVEISGLRTRAGLLDTCSRAENQASARVPGPEGTPARTSACAMLEWQGYFGTAPKLSTRFRKYGNVSITRSKTAPFSRGSVCGLIPSRDRRERSGRNTSP